MALVQTPQDFYNLASFEHSRTAARDGFNEQSLFYRAILAGKNRWQAAFWCGTSALLRVNALKEVGGVATGTVTEDIHTTIRLHAAGWRSVYHNEVLARGWSPPAPTSTCCNATVGGPAPSPSGLRSGPSPSPSPSSSWRCGCWVGAGSGPG